MRPNCGNFNFLFIIYLSYKEKILQYPSVIKKMNIDLLVEVDEGVPFLLKTIVFPKNMHYLTERLPKPNYAPLKTKTIDKNKLLLTLSDSHENYLKTNEEKNQNYMYSKKLPQMHIKKKNLNLNIIDNHQKKKYKLLRDYIYNNNQNDSSFIDNLEKVF